MAYKTPGVYIVEQDAFPNSVVEVETAVPAFIGYTQKASNKGASLANKPWRITSMAQYLDYFGGGPEFEFYVSDVETTLNTAVADATKKSNAANAVKTDAEAKLAANAAAQALVLAVTAANTNKKDADDALAKVQESPTLKAAVDEADNNKKNADEALAKDPNNEALKTAATEAGRKKTDADSALANDPYTKAKTAVDEANQKKKEADEKLAANPDAVKLQKDLDAATLDAKKASDALAKATDAVSSEKLKAYLASCDYDFMAGDTKYLIQQTGGKCLLYQSMLLFFQNGGGACYVVSVGTFNDAKNEGIMPSKITDGIDALKKEQEPTIVVVPDAVRLERANCISVQQHMLKHCGYEMKNRFAILDLYGGYLPRTDPSGDCVAAFRDALGVNQLDFAAAYYPWINTTIVQDSDLDYTIFTDTEAQTLLKTLLNEDLRIGNSYVPPATQKIALKNYSDKAKAVSDIGQTFEAFSAEYKAKEGNEEADADTVKSEFKKRIKAVHQLLTLNSPRYVSILSLVKQKLNLLPPSAAMAGVYTAVDKSRGVWKAPANVSLNSVISPAVNISQEEQEDLNVTTAGKSINAIRAFIGEGTLVWGARTLDGNSLDWRYINVRRTMIMLEESLRLATKAYVFEPNVANTWVTIKSMIRNFLTGIWKRGGLAGATPDDAFSVFVGLGETMTAEDILEGLLNVTVLVALSRPAEFIEITFQQQLQKS